VTWGDRRRGAARPALAGSESRATARCETVPTVLRHLTHW
jgi:hypothetical protein